MPFPTVPGTKNFTVRKGATFQARMTWTASGTAINFTGYSGEITIWDVDGLQIFNGTGSPTVNLGVDGSMVITITAAETAAEEPTCGSYRLTLTDSNGAITDWLAGSFNITAE